MVSTFPTWYWYEFIDFIVPSLQHTVPNGHFTQWQHVGFFLGDGKPQWRNRQFMYAQIRPSMLITTHLECTPHSDPVQVFAIGRSLAIFTPFANRNPYRFAHLFMSILFSI
jgi:hypothetical protein